MRPDYAENSSAHDLGIHIKLLEEDNNDTLKLKEMVDALLHEKPGKFSVGYKSLSNGDEFVINPESMYAASVIKIFIMASVYHQVNNNEITLDEKLVLKNEDKVGGTGSLSGREGGTEFTIRQLIEVMITESDNTSTNMLIDKLGFDKINAFIVDQGCKGTILQRKMMDQERIDKRIENLTSAKDLILILERLYNGECVSPEYDEEMLGIMKKQKNRSRIPALLPQDTVVANKTGDLSRVVNDAGIVYTDKGDFIISVLSRDSSNPSQAGKTIAEIARVLFEEQLSSGLTSDQ